MLIGAFRCACVAPAPAHLPQTGAMLQPGELLRSRLRSLEGPEASAVWVVLLAKVRHAAWNCMAHGAAWCCIVHGAAWVVLLA